MADVDSTNGITDGDYYYGHDHLYSPVVLFDAAGDVAERVEYDAYGSVRIFTDGDQDGVWFDDPDDPVYASSQIGNPYLFTGRRLDIMDSGSLKIYHYRARAYDPETGRFMQRDPMSYIDGMNLYEYVKSQPLMYLDYTGKQCVIGGWGGFLRALWRFASDNTGTSPDIFWSPSHAYWGKWSKWNLDKNCITPHVECGEDLTGKPCKRNSMKFVNLCGKERREKVATNTFKPVLKEYKQIFSWDHYRGVIAYKTQKRKLTYNTYADVESGVMFQCCGGKWKKTGTPLIIKDKHIRTEEVTEGRVKRKFVDKKIPDVPLV
ncbi:MAG: hypothetical protein GF364_03730 [Candidatus Lokiarchaeota archaeon]|nr:hypothetical protein [Candidatus Lokiarchaeota archaeon]